MDDPKPTVLVVEDDVLVQNIAADLAEEAGFDAITAENAADAIRLLEKHPQISVVFTDVDMPGGLNGMELAKMVRKRWPPVRVLITSGKIGPKRDALPPQCMFLSKPYDAEQVINALRALLKISCAP